MLNKLVPSGENTIYKKAVWLYFFLLIFEGALRKWILPAFSTSLLLVRDPIVIWLVIVGLYKGWLNNGYVIVMMIVITLSLVTTLLFGHQNLTVALYGWRFYFFHFPFIFIIGKVLKREDVLKMGRFVLYLSIPMIVFIIIQFYSPQSAWVNNNVGGGEGQTLAGALGYYRPSGIFSAGYVEYNLVVGCFLFYYLFANKTLKSNEQIKSWILWIMLGCYLLSIPYSISRTNFFQAIGILMFFLVGGLMIRKYQKQILKSVILGVAAIALILNFNLQGDGLDAFTARFESASETEGGALQGTIGNRYFGSTLRAFSFEVPFFGYGLGVSSNAGNAISEGIKYKYFNADQEWSSIIGENGILFGMIIIALRVLLSLSIFKKSFQFLKRDKDVLLWILLAGLLMSLPMGQMEVSIRCGFVVFISGICLSVINNKNKITK